MNPNASVFVPFIKVDPAEKRAEQINFVNQQIDSLKKELSTNNTELVSLHNELNTKHSALLQLIAHKEKNIAPYCSQEHIDYLQDEYSQRLSIYYSKYTKFNDKTSDLVTLQQKLHRLIITPITNTNNNSPASSHSSDSGDLSSNNLQHPHIHHNHHHSVHGESSNTSNPFGHNISIRVLDGIDITRSYSPPSTPHTVLPPIQESDKESVEWRDDEDDSQWTQDDQDGDNHDIKEQTPSEATTATITITIDASTMTENDSQFNIIPMNKQNGQSMTSLMSSLSIQENMDPNINMMESVQTPNAEQQTKDEEKYGIPIADYDELEKEINIMLENMMYSDIDAICGQFNEYISQQCIDCKCIELLIDLIICHGVEHKPVFFGSKYSILCQSIVNNYEPGKQSVVDMDEFNAMKSINVMDLIWKSCHETFRKLQFGNDGQKFINCMIIMAELLNANLISIQCIFEFIFEPILCEQRSDLCENDIEGLYEIFKRCSRILTNDYRYQHQLERYFKTMDKIKNLKKFQYGINRVPFMVNQMKKLTINRQRDNYRNNKNHHHHHHQHHQYQHHNHNHNHNHHNKRRW